MRDYAQVRKLPSITLDLVRDGLERLEIGTLGLERLDREILRMIIERYGGGPVGAETLAISVANRSTRSKISTSRTLFRRASCNARRAAGRQRIWPTNTSTWKRSVQPPACFNVPECAVKGRVLP
jgi:hypothetical protein